MDEEIPTYKLRREDFIPMDGLDKYYPERNRNVPEEYTIPRTLLLTAYNTGLIISGLAVIGALLGVGAVGFMKGLEYLLK